MSHRTIGIVVAGDPQPQGSLRAIVNYDRTGRPFANVVHDDSAKLTTWRDLVGIQARNAMVRDTGIGMLVGPLSIQADFYLPKPPSVTRGRPHVKPDGDKLLRAVCDALEGVMYRNDSQLCDYRVQKFYEGYYRPGVILNVSELE